MFIKEVRLKLKRDVRHEPYNVSQCAAELVGEMEKGDDLGECYKEVKEDVQFIVEEMVEDERRKFKIGQERLHGVKNK